jgi:hypothetical protein
MTPQELLDRLVVIFPNFAFYWDQPENYFRDEEGVYALHGVFAQFTGFFIEQFEVLSDIQIASLGEFVSACMSALDENLDNAAATCFVENIAGDPPGSRLAPYLIGSAQKYYQLWSGQA